MALSKEEILDAIAEMSVIDIVDLIEAMEEKFGVSAAAPVAAAAPAAAGGDEGGEAEADDAPVDIHLSEVGDKKVDVIKAVRAITGLGLKVANDMVDWTYGICLGIGTLNGGWFTSRWSVKKGENVIRIFLTVIVVIMAIKLWFF